MTPIGDDEIHPGDGPDHEESEPTGLRGLLSTMWFRAVLVLVVVAGIAAVSVPYVLDSVNPPPKPVATAVIPPKPVVPPPAKSVEPPAPAAVPAAPAPIVPTTAATRSEESSARPAPEASTRSAADVSAAAKSAAVEKAERATEASKSATDAPKRTAAKPAGDSGPRRAVKPVGESPSSSRPSAQATGEYWVQVGAFRDPAMAHRLAERLRSRNLPVEESTTATTRAAETPAAAAPPPAPASDSSDRYEVFVTGASPGEVSAKLTAKGLAASPVADGAVIKPSLPLRDAVALSQDLSADGFKVHVKRAGAPAARAASPPSAAGRRETLHRVRVGAFPDRASALEARKQLEDLGYTAFIARGRE